MASRQTNPRLRGRPRIPDISADRPIPKVGHNLPPVEPRLTYRVREVIKLTGLSQSTIYEMMDEGTLRSTKVRGIRLIFADSLRDVLALT